MADKITLIADIKIDKIDASALGKALQTELGKTTTGVNAAVAGGGGGKGMKGGGDIAVALQAVLGDALEDILKSVNSMVKVLLALAGIGIFLKIIADVTSAMWDGFKSIGKVWGAMLSMISKMVEPFVNLLIPLLIPFLQIMSLVAKALNLILMPLFNMLMKAFAPKGDVMKEAFEKIMGGDILGGISVVLEDMAKSFEEVKDEIANTLMPLFDALAKGISDFLDPLSESNAKLNEVIINLLGEQLGGVVIGFIDILRSALTVVSDFITKGGIENLTEVLTSLWDNLTGLLDTQEENPLDEIWELLATTISLAAEAMGVVSGWLDNNKGAFIGALNELLYTHFPKVSTLLYLFRTKLTTFLETQWPPVVTAMETMVSAVNAFSSTLSSFDIGGFISNFIGAGGSAPTMAMREGISAAAGAVVPGGESIYNISITGNGDRQLEDLIRRTVEDVAAKSSREGHFQRGY